MSRIGKLPITIPPGVTVNISGNNITVKGPKGELKRTIRPEVTVKLEDGKLMVARHGDEKEPKAFHGLTRTLLANMVEGVSKGFEKTLEIVGVGLRVEKAGDKIALRLGYSHPIEVTPMPGISFAVEGTNRIKVSGINKESVGEQAAEIRGMRIRDVYKSKGIKYAGEKVRLKPGKAGKVVGRK